MKLDRSDMIKEVLSVANSLKQVYSDLKNIDNLQLEPIKNTISAAHVTLNRLKDRINNLYFVKKIESL